MGGASCKCEKCGKWFVGKTFVPKEHGCKTVNWDVPLFTEGQLKEMSTEIDRQLAELDKEFKDEDGCRDYNAEAARPSKTLQSKLY